MSTNTASDTSFLHPYERDGTWYAYWTDEDGKRIRRSLGVKAQRQVPKALVKLAAEILKERNKKATLTLGQYAGDFFGPDCRWTKRRAAMNHPTKDSTKEFYRRALQLYILPAHGSIPLDQIAASTIEDLAASLEISNAYKNEVMRTYRVILDEAARERLIPPVAAPDRFGRNTQPKDVLTDQDLEKLFPDDPEAMAEIWAANFRYEPPHAGLMFGAMYALMVSTGMRSGEARGLQLDHVFLEQEAIAIVQAIDLAEQVAPLKKASSTDSRARVAILPDRTARALGWWLEKRQGETHFVFEFWGRHIQRKLVLDRWHLGIERAGVADGRNLTPHSLRYTYNTRMENKLPGEVLRSIVGHKSEAMTQHYSRPVIAERIKELALHKAAVNNFWK